MSSISNLRALAASLLLLALVTPAHALKLKGLDIDQVVYNDDYPAIRVKFNHAADNWTDVTTQQVDVSISWKLDVEASHALAPPSEISINLDNMSAEEELRSTNNHLTERHSGTIARHLNIESFDGGQRSCDALRINRDVCGLKREATLGLLPRAGQVCRSFGLFQVDAGHYRELLPELGIRRDRRIERQGAVLINAHRRIRAGGKRDREPTCGIDHGGLGLPRA